MLPQMGRRALRRPRLVASILSSNHLTPTTKRYYSSSTSPEGSRLRHRRKRSNRWDDDTLQPAAPMGLSSPFESSEATPDKYLEKASLSPWVPTPDPIARKMLELAKAGSDDIHVDLGSGDGRVNFHAIDPPFSVQQSIGIDVDENLVEMAQERLSKRHPTPNVEFVVSDLLDNQDIYMKIRKATIITMYFVTDALKLIQPQLTSTFKGRDVRIVTCGYAMPDWEPQWVEVILGLPVHLYELRANEEIRLAPQQRDQVDEEEELSPISLDENDDVERVEMPLYDPEDKVHWEKIFDSNDSSDDPDEPPPIWWRNPK